MRNLFENHSEVMTILSLVIAYVASAMYRSKGVHSRSVFKYALLAVLAVTFGFFIDVGLSPIIESLDQSKHIQLCLFVGGIVYYMCMMSSLLHRGR